MVIRSLGLLLLLTCTCCMAQVAGPASVKPGELIELKAEGAGQSWMVLEPADLPYRTYENGHVFVCASGAGQLSRIIVLCVSWDTKRIDRHVVAVEGVDPTPPIPPPPVPPPDDYLGFGTLAAKNIPAATAPLKHELAKVYLGMAAAIDSGALTSPLQAQQKLLASATAFWRNNGGRPAQAQWDAWAAAIQSHFESLNITDVKELAKAYRAIAAGLTRIPRITRSGNAIRNDTEASTHTLTPTRTAGWSRTERSLDRRCVT